MNAIFLQTKRQDGQQAGTDRIARDGWDASQDLLDATHIKTLLGGSYAGFHMAICRKTKVGFLISPELAQSGQYQKDGYEVRPALPEELAAQEKFDRSMAPDIDKWGAE